MRKWVSISKQQAPFLVTIFILVLLGAGYIYMYIPKNERALEEQHFRWLQRVDRNIRVKIENSDTLLSLMLQAYMNPAFSKDSVRKVIAHFPRTNFILCDTVITKSSDSLGDNITSNAGPVFSIKTDDQQRNFIISATQKYKDSLLYRISMCYRFENFITPLLPKDIFDHYIIFYKGHYVYEDFHSGLAYKNEDSLLQIKRGITGASIADQNVGGVDYKMFLQPIYLKGNEQFILTGLHRLAKYNAEKRELPTDFSLFLITLALAVFIFIPWIRIYFMGASDRLKLSDVAGSVLVAKFLMALLVFFFFKYHYSFLPTRESTFSRKNLAQAISTSFKAESKLAYTGLASLDSIIKTDSLYTDIRNISGERSMEKLTGANAFFAGGKGNYAAIDTNLKKKLKKLSESFPFTEVNWLDAKGFVKFNWSSKSFNNIHTSYAYRGYFRNINNNDKALQVDGISFYMEPLVSGTNGSFTTIISRKSVLDSNATNKAAVVAMSFKMKCLDRALLPAGYSFAIINNNADVLYHSDSTRNLNENLLEEFSEKKKLGDALQGRFSGAFATEYYEGSYMVRADPIKDFPYFIVIINNTNFAGNADIEMFSFTWGMIFFFVFIALADLFILIFSSSRRSYFKKQFLITSWLWPRRSSHPEYMVATLGNSVLIICLLIIYASGIFTYPVFFFALVVTIPMLTIFLNALFLKKYKKLKNQVFLSYKMRCARWNLGFLLLLNGIAISIAGLQAFYLLIIFQLMLYALCRITWMKKDEITSFVLQVPFLRNIGYISSYSGMLFTRLIITSGIPAMFFYTAAYNYEQNLLARYREFDFAKQLKKKAGINIDTVVLHAPENAVYADGYWIRDFRVVEKSELEKKTYTQEYTNQDNLVADAFAFWGIDVLDLASDNDHFYKKHSDDSSVIYNDFFKDVLYKRDSASGMAFVQLNNPATYIGVSSVPVKYSFPSLFYIKGWVFWITIFIFLSILFIVLKSIIKKLFAINMPRLNALNNADAYILQNLNHYKRVFIVGLPGSGKLQNVLMHLSAANKDFLYDKDNAAQNNVAIINLMKAIGKDDEGWGKMQQNTVKEQHKYIIIDHFDYDDGSVQTSDNKLRLMHTILGSAKNKMVIILSRKEPSECINLLTQNAAESEYVKAGRLSVLWQNLLSDFPVVVMPLSISKNMDDATLMETVGAQESTIPLYIKQSVDEETRRSVFLNQLKPALASANDDWLKPQRKATDLLSLQLQVTAHNYYTNLWFCLSDEEKFIMYDLAEEGLVNTKNFFIVNMLINKGMIVEREGNLHVFNKSFRNFIVTSIGQTEAEKMNQQIKTGSNWSKLQGPLLIAIVAILAFLFISQDGLYTKFIAIISGLATGIPTLVKIFSGLNKPMQKDIKNIGA
jgi:hypothetical protein